MFNSYSSATLDQKTYDNACWRFRSRVVEALKGLNMIGATDRAAELFITEEKETEFKNGESVPEAVCV
jgi:hypothetical protein